MNESDLVKTNTRFVSSHPPSSSPLRSPRSLPLFVPLSLHHHSLPPSGVTAHWLQVVREEGRKGCREGWMEEELKAGGGVSVICPCVDATARKSDTLLSVCCFISFM